MANWEKEKGWYKIMNLESPKEHVAVAFNGKPIYRFVNNSIAEIPHAIANIINGAVKTVWSSDGKSMVQTEQQRYLAVPVENPNKEEKKEKDIAKGLFDAKKTKVSKDIEDED